MFFYDVVYISITEYTHEVYEIKISKVLNCNNSVGNEWAKYHWVNGKNITGGEGRTVPTGKVEN